MQASNTGVGGDPIHDVKGGSEYTKRHQKTLLKALRKGELVGYQARAGCSWRIYQSDLDAWIKGDKPKQKRA